MKSALLITFLLFSFDSEATSVFSQWMKAISNFKAPAVESSDCCETDQEKLINQCARDLCGESSTINSAVLTDTEFESNYRDPLIDAEFEAFKPQIEVYAQNLSKEIEYISNGIEKKLRENPNLWDGANLERNDLDGITNEVLQDMSSIVVDPEKNSIEIEFEPQIQERFPELLKGYTDFRKDQILSSTYNKISYGVYSVEQAKSINEESVKKIEASLEILNQHVSKEKIQKIKDKLTRVVEEQLNQSSQNWQHANVFTELNNIKVDVRAESNGLPAEIQKKFDLDIFKWEYGSFQCHQHQSCSEFYSYVMQETIKPSEILLNARKAFENRDALDKMVNNCRLNWYEDFIGLTDAQDVEDFRKQLPEIQKRLLNNALGSFSDHSKEEFKKLIAELSHQFPHPSDENRQKLEDFLAMFKNVSQYYNAPNSDVYEKSLLSMYYDLKTISEPYENLKNLCTDTIFRPDDYYSPEQFGISHINVSAYSCNHFHHGKRIYAHEVGHALSDWINTNRLSENSKKSYLELRSCIKESYLIQSSPFYSFNHPGDSAYVEEDMADVISFLTYPDPNESLFTCILLEPHKNGVDYANLSLSPGHEGPHSESIVRVINEALYKGAPIGTSCQKLLDQNKETIKLRKCR